MQNSKSYCRCSRCSKPCLCAFYAAKYYFDDHVMNGRENTVIEDVTGIYVNYRSSCYRMYEYSSICYKFTLMRGCNDFDNEPLKSVVSINIPVSMSNSLYAFYVHKQHIIMFSKAQEKLGPRERE